MPVDTGRRSPDEHDWRSERTTIIAGTALAKAGIQLKSGHEPGQPVAQLLADRNAVRRLINQHRETMLNIAGTDPKGAEALMDEVGALGAIAARLQILLDNEQLTQDVIARGDPARGLPARGFSDRIQVLGPKDSLAAMAGPREDPGAGTFGFGELLRAMVVGTSNPAIRAALSEGTDSAGGYTVPTRLLRQVIDLMRARTTVVQAGASTVMLDTLTTSIARLATDPTAGWRNEAAAIAESGPTFEKVTFTARSLAVLVKVSRELLDDSANINEALMMAFAGAMAVETDRVALFGSGSAPEPLGLFGATNVSAVSMGTNGAQLTGWGKVLDAVLELQNYNAPTPTAMIMAPRTWRAIAGFADSTGQPLRPPADIEGIPRLSSTSVPINQTQGSASNASCIMAGDFSQLMIGVRQELRIEVLRELYAANHQYGFVAHLRMDVQVARPRAFAVLKGIIP